MRKFRNMPKIAFIVVILLITYTISLAQPQYTRKPSAQEKRQQLEQDSSTAIAEISTKHQEILGYVNSNKTPSKQALREALNTIARNRKYLPVLDNTQKSVYHVLSAWVYYFDSKPDKAIKQIASAQKIAPQDPDVIKTHFIISIAYKDYASVAQAMTKQNTDDEEETESQSYQQQSGGNLQLDTNSVQIGLLGKTFNSQPQPIGPNSTSWQSAGQLICALLWKIDANELDSFAPPEKAKPAETNEPNKPLHEPNLPAAAAPESHAESNDNTAEYKNNNESKPNESSLLTEENMPVSYGDIRSKDRQTKELSVSEFEAFSQLQNQFTKDKRAVFTTINLNDPAKKENLENWLSKSLQIRHTFLLPRDGQQKISDCLGGNIDKPTLLVVAPDSIIRYAGKTEGFLPKMIIRDILENPQEFIEPNEPNRPPVDANLNPPAVKPVQPAHVPPLPNIPRTLTADANKQQPQTNTAAAQEKPKVDDDFAAVDNYQAETLLSNAKTFLQIGNRFPSHMYRKPVEICRQVMKDYPNTKYAQEAQMLLRNVPKEYHQQYNLTNEELGL
jgi:hypothetical protein